MRNIGNCIGQSGSALCRTFFFPRLETRNLSSKNPNIAGRSDNRIWKLELRIWKSKIPNSKFKTMEKPQFFTSKESLPEGTGVLDAFERSLKELFFVRNPKFKKGMPETDAALAEFLGREAPAVEGVFVYYPWLHQAVRLP